MIFLRELENTFGEKLAQNNIFRGTLIARAFCAERTLDFIFMGTEGGGLYHEQISPDRRRSPQRENYVAIALNLSYVFLLLDHLLTYMYRSP